METILDYNANFEEREEERLREEEKLSHRRQWAKVLCPICKCNGNDAEMYYDPKGNWEPRFILNPCWENPIKCPKCGYRAIKKDRTSYGDYHY